MLALAVLILHAAGGCATDDSAQGPTVSAVEGNPTNELWKQGYGFNNPNVDRIRDGKKSADFQGTPNNDGPGVKIEQTFFNFDTK